MAVESNTYRPRSASEIVVEGIPSSPGIASGKAYVIRREHDFEFNKNVSKDAIPEELRRLESAFEDVLHEYSVLIERTRDEAKEAAQVLESAVAILEDAFFREAAIDLVKSGFSAEGSLVEEFDKHKKILIKSKDVILRERAIELEHIKERLLFALRNRCVYYALEPSSVIVSASITPAEMISFRDSKVAAVLTELGGISSHMSILARSFEIPAIIGVRNASKIIKNGDLLSIDGYSGKIVVNPGAKTAAIFALRKRDEEKRKKELGKLKKLPAETLDGRKISLQCNIDDPDDIERVAGVGAEGIGLVRSEHMVLKLGKFPDRETQLRRYQEIAERAYPNPAKIRVFDVGSDKFAEGTPKREANPALGFRGIRFLLYREDIFIDQVLAILQASAHKNVQIMLPMITGPSEVDQALGLIEACKTKLSREGADFDPNIPVGVMIETPAAAMLADRFSDDIKFFSLGANDLTQYALAADRTNEMVTDRFNAFHPAVLKFIDMTIKAAEKKKIPVGVCGEIGGHPAATALLVGMGVTELSVSPAALPEIKKRIRSIKYSDSRELARKALSCAYENDIRKLLAI